MATRYR